MAYSRMTLLNGKERLYQFFCRVPNLQGDLMKFPIVVKPLPLYGVTFGFSPQDFPLQIFLSRIFFSLHFFLDGRHLYLQVKIGNLNFRIPNFSCLIQGIQFLNFSKFSYPGGFTNKIIIIIIIIIIIRILIIIIILFIVGDERV